MNLAACEIYPLGFSPNVQNGLTRLIRNEASCQKNRYLSLEMAGLQMLRRHCTGKTCARITQRLFNKAG